MKRFGEILSERIGSYGIGRDLEGKEVGLHNRACSLVMRLNPNRFKFNEEKKLYSTVMALLFQQEPLPSGVVAWLEEAVSRYSKEAEDRGEDKH